MATPAPVALTWNGYVAQVCNMAVVATTTVSGVLQGVDPETNVLLPQACNYAELRIQRDLDLNASLTSNAYTFTAGNNVLSIPVGDFVALQTLSVSGVPLIPVSKEFIQNVYGTNANPGSPQYFAPYGGDMATAGNTSNNFIVGPYPDSNYPVAVTGTIRLPSLYQSATTPLAAAATTFISTWLPDLLIQASMIYVSEYQRQFSGASNDPDMPGSYELQYGNLLKGALVEEARKKFSASAWSAMSPPVVASPSR